MCKLKIPACQIIGATARACIDLLHYLGTKHAKTNRTNWLPVFSFCVFLTVRRPVPVLLMTTA